MDAYTANSQDLESFLPYVHSVAEKAEAIPSHCEESFLALGQAARDCYSGSKELELKLAALLNSISGEGEDSISKLTDAMCELSTDGLEKVTLSLSEDDAFQSALHKQMRHLLRECSFLSNASTYFNMLSTNIRITAAGIPSANEMFSSVSDSTLKLSKDIKQASEDIEKLISSFILTQSRVSGTVEKEIQHISQLNAKIQRELKSAHKEVTRMTSQSKEELSLFNEKGSDISRLIGDLVMSVQFHDRMRQRLEHVQEALSDEMHCLSAADDEVSKLQFYFLVKLQEEQVKEILIETEELSNKVVQTLKGIFSDVQSISLQGENQEKHRDINAGLSRLEKTMIQQLETQKRAEQSSKSIRDSLGETVEKISQIKEFLVVIDSWGLQAQLVSLNASIKASKLGEVGASLAVLSQEIVRQSEILQEIVLKLSGMIETVHVLIDEKEFQETNVSEIIEQSLQKLLTAADSYRNVGREDVVSALTTLSNLVEKTLGSTSFFAALKNDLIDLISFLSTLEKSVKPFLETEDLESESRASALEKLYEMYTMEEEREIHKKYFGIPGAKKASDEIENPSSSEDVDLFDDDSDLWDTNEEDGSVSLFEDTEGSEASEEAYTEDEDLGDNVELF